MRAPAPLAAAVALALAGCQSPASRTPALPGTPHVVHLEMDDYAFRYDPAIPGGRVLVRVRNVGSVPHNVMLIPLTDDMPPVDDQLRGGVRRPVTPLARTTVQPPGARTTFAAELDGGVRYALVCFLDDDDRIPHWQKGMSSEFRATGGPPPGATKENSENSNGSGTSTAPPRPGP